MTFSEFSLLIHNYDFHLHQTLCRKRQKEEQELLERERQQQEQQQQQQQQQNEIHQETREQVELFKSTLIESGLSLLSSYHY